MKILLFAHQNWGVETIRTIKKTKHEIIHVFTHPMDMDKNEKTWYESVKHECELHNIPVMERKNIEDDDVSLINNLSPDLILSVGWRRLIPKSIFDIPKFGTINMHEALLPNYRGFAPINWAIINDETETGITIHYIDETADTGDIIIQKKISIEYDDNANTVYKKLLALTPEIISELLEQIESNSLKLNSQKGRKGFFCSRRFPDDSKIDWSETRFNVYNLIRALSDPYPNAFCFYNDQKIYIKNAKLLNDDYRGECGKICSIRDDGIVVTCGKNHKENQAILITNIATENDDIKPSDFFKLWSELK